MAALALAGVAHADEPTASQAFHRGVEALRAQDYAAAADAFQRSYALSPKAATMCNLALTYDRWAGHASDAIEAYRKCAEDDESGRFRDHALERARQLREQLASAPPSPSPPAEAAPRKPEPPIERPVAPVESATTTPPATTPPTPPTTTTPPPAPPVAAPAVAAPASIAAPPPATRRSFFRDPAACTLTLAGVAGIAAGIGLAVAGKLDDDSVAHTTDLGQKATLYDRAGVLLPAGYITLAAGAALVVAGVVEWAVHGRHVSSAHAARAAWSF